MEKIQEKLWEEEQRSLSNRRLLTESFILDNNFSQLRLQSTKLELNVQDDDDIYILWLTNEMEKESESLNDINIRLFHSNNTIIDFISELQTSNIFLIIDHELVSNILSFLDDFSQILCIYVLINEENNDTLIVTDSKRTIRQISHEKEELFQLIIEDIDTFTKDFICRTIFDLTTTEESTNQTKNTSFIWYYLLIESLFDLNVYNESPKSDFIEYCRQQYSIDNIHQQSFISQFENEYSSENAIRWYTRDSFIYRQLNKALRTRDIDAIFKLRFFIIDFQKQLEEHSNEQTIQSFHTVYRGQHMSQLELTKLKNTSLDKNIALTYASGSFSVVFEIEINSGVPLKNKRLRPAYVDDKSYFPEELEVIFPIGSTFLVDSITMEDNQWYIKLKLTDDHDYNKMIDLIQTKFIKQVSSKVKFASLLQLSGDSDKAERYIHLLIEDLQLSSDNVNLGYAYYIMGDIQGEKGDYDGALSCFDRALTHIEPEDIYRAKIYRWYGEAYSRKGEFSIALEYLNKALQYQQELDPLELADLYEGFGNVYREMNNFDNALMYLNQVLDIRRSNLSTHQNWPTYIYLARVYEAKSDYTVALRFLKYALNILSEIAPKNHPHAIWLYGYIGFTYLQCKNLSSVIIYSQKAFDLIQMADHKQNFSLNRNILIGKILSGIVSNYNLIANCYLDTGNYDKALSYLQKIDQILNEYKGENELVGRDTIYLTIGTTYRSMKHYDQAIFHYEKRLAYISNDYNKYGCTCRYIASIYYETKDYLMAISKYKIALTFLHNSQIINHEIIAQCYSGVAQSYAKIKNYEYAFIYFEQELKHHEVIY